MREQPKRKNDRHTLLKLKLLLVGFIFGTWIALLYPLVWLAPPFFWITPYVYVGLSMLWIPVVWRVSRHITTDKIVVMLIVLCMFSSSTMAFEFRTYTTHEAYCNEIDVESNTIRCYTTDGSCGMYGHDFDLVGNLLIAQRNPRILGQAFIYCLF